MPAHCSTVKTATLTMLAARPRCKEEGAARVEAVVGRLQQHQLERRVHVGEMVLARLVVLQDVAACGVGGRARAGVQASLLPGAAAA